MAEASGAIAALYDRIARQIEKCRQQAALVEVLTQTERALRGMIVENAARGERLRKLLSEQERV
jgi:hypothetical protein